MRTGIVIVLAAAVAALVYGYWHVSTHGSLYISVDDASNRSHPQPVKDVRMRLLGEDGRELAKARADDRYGAISLTEPERHSCHQYEKLGTTSAEDKYQWQVCSEQQSRWLVSWVHQIRFAEIRTGDCTLLTPVKISRYADAWWMWWIPLPHVGGKPYTLFSINIPIDRQRCAFPGEK